jgi:hypothetical protein
LTRLLKSAPSTEPSGWMPEDQPRSCDVCGRKVTLKDPEPLWFDTFQRKTYHAYCRIGA